MGFQAKIGVHYAAVRAGFAGWIPLIGFRYFRAVPLRFVADFGQQAAHCGVGQRFGPQSCPNHPFNIEGFYAEAVISEYQFLAQVMVAVVA